MGRPSMVATCRLMRPRWVLVLDLLGLEGCPILQHAPMHALLAPSCQQLCRLLAHEQTGQPLLHACSMQGHVVLLTYSQTRHGGRAGQAHLRARHNGAGHSAHGCRNLLRRCRWHS